MSGSFTVHNLTQIITRLALRLQVGIVTRSNHRTNTVMIRANPPSTPVAKAHMIKRALQALQLPASQKLLITVEQLGKVNTDPTSSLVSLHRPWKLTCTIVPHQPPAA